MPGLPVYHQFRSLLKLIFITSVMPSNHLILCGPFLLLPSIFPSSFLMSQFFASGGQSVGRFSFSISPSNEYSGLISFRMDRLDLLAVQGPLKRLLQHSKVRSCQCAMFAKGTLGARYQQEESLEYVSDGYISKGRRSRGTGSLMQGGRETGKG